MENPSHVAQSFFRLPYGISFQVKGQHPRMEESPRFLRDFQTGPLPPNTVMGATTFPNPNTVKPSFSIDSLLGLKEGVIQGHHPIQSHLPCPIHNQLSYPSHQHLRHHHEETSKVKSSSSLRYAPYKRERKTSTQITTGDPKESVGRSNGKAKRVRTIFTPEQLEKLESEFERQQYMVGTERSYLAESLDLTEAQVKVWFQNRRIKWRKVHLEMQQERLRAIRSQEAREEFDESSGSSEVVGYNEDYNVPRPSVKSDEGSYEVVKVDWDPPSFDVDAYFLKTLGTLRPVPTWICPAHGPSDSESESE